VPIGVSCFRCIETKTQEIARGNAEENDGMDDIDSPLSLSSVQDLRYPDREVMQERSDVSVGKFDVNRMLLDAALTKAIRDLQANPEQTLRRWTEKNGAKIEGSAQQALLLQIKELLRNPNGSYHRLIGRLAGETKSERLKALAMNLGYNAYKIGAETMRAQELRYGVHIPWTVLFELGGSVTAAHIHAIVEQGKKLGIYTYQLFCRTEQALVELPGLLEKQKDAVFLIYLRPDWVNDRLVASWSQFHNFVPLLLAQPGQGEAAFALLRGAGFLCGACLEYDVGTADAMISGAYLDYAADMGAAFAIAWPKAGLTAPLRNEVSIAVQRHRAAQRKAVFPIDLMRDCLDIDRLLSKEEALLYFDSRGQRLLIEEGHREGMENLFQNSFLQILEGL